MSQQPADSSSSPQPGAPGTPGAAGAAGAPANDLVAERRAKLARLRDELHVDPFGGREDGLISLASAAARYDAGADEAHKAASAAAPRGGTPQPQVGLADSARPLTADAATPSTGHAATPAPSADPRPRVKVAGRVMLSRDIGKLIFMTLRDQTGDLQVALNKKEVGEQAFKIAKIADVGDIVVCEGPLAKTKTGEVTVWVQGDGFRMASKTLEPPVKSWQASHDPEARYRRRYVDLWANPQVMKTMILRTRIVEEIRQFLRQRGYTEVETPMLQLLHGGAAARPFTTHHNALDIPLFMRIAPELFLKRLLVGGFSKVFEINRNFRNEGISPRHNPEFTMLEAYEAFGSWETMADLVEEMICTVAQNVLGTLVIEHKDADGKVTKTINLTRPWRRVTMAALVQERTGWEFDKTNGLLKAPAAVFDEIVLRLGKIKYNLQGLPLDVIQAKLIDLAKHIMLLSPAEQLVELYEKLIEPTLIDPTYVTHVPSVCIPLARENKADPFFADVYELAINGQEISPGYSELNDPDVQERHFRHQVGDKEEQQKVDEDFLAALRVGMPPAGGIGLGIDRLVMMLTGAESIRDVILFPLMRPVDKTS